MDDTSQIAAPDASPAEPRAAVLAHRRTRVCEVQYRRLQSLFNRQGRVVGFCGAAGYRAGRRLTGLALS